MSTQAKEAPPQATAWLNVATKVAGAGFSFLLFVVMARATRPEAFAHVAVIFAWLAIAGNVAGLSAPMVLIRFVPDYLASAQPGLARGVVQLAFAATIAVSLALAGLFAAVILSHALALPHELRRSVLVAAALLPPSVLLLDLAGLLMALKRAPMAEFLTNVVRPALTAAGVAVLWFVQRGPLPAPTVLDMYLAASVTMAAVSLAYTFAVVPRAALHAAPRFRARAWSHAAVGFVLVTATAALHQRVDIMMMGAIAQPADVATYAVAARFSLTVSIAVSAVYTVIAPHVVEHLADLHEGRLEHMQPLVRSGARTAFYVCLLALAAFALLGPLLLRLFGTHYGQAYTPLVVLATGQVVAALAGPATSLATFAGQPRIAIIAFGAGIVTNVVLNLLLVPRLGGTGAALATTAGLVCAAVLGRALTRKRYGIDTAVFS